VIDHVLERVRELLAWIDEPATSLPVAPELPPFRLGPPLETTIAPRGGHYWGAGQRLEVVRFAGANLLMVEFSYSGKHRIVEPYSLRRKGTGNLLLYGWEQGAGTIKAFDTAKIRDLAVTNTPFVPRYRIEFTGG
jgi:hypothetical protein